MKLNKINWSYRFSLLSALFVMTTTAWTQQMKWSENYPMNSIFNKNEVVQASIDGFYVLQNYKDANYYYQQNIGFYTLDFKKREQDKPMRFLYDGTYQFAMAGVTSPYVGHAVDDVGQQKETLFITLINSSTLAPVSVSTELIKTDYKNKTKPKGGYRYATSEDGSKILFYSQAPYRKKEKGAIDLLLVDSEFEELGKGVAKLNQDANILTVNDIVDAVVTNEGLVYFLCKIYKNKDKKEEKKVGKRFVYSLVQMDCASNTKMQVLDTLKVLSPQDSAIIVSAKLSINNTSGTITCLGTYKIPRKKAGLFSLDAKEAFSTMPVVIDYPDTVLALEAKMPRKIKKKKHLSLKNYKIKSIFEQTDGAKIIVAEQHYINVYWDKSEGRQEQHKLHNLLLIKLVGQKIVWSKVLPKRQRAGAAGYTNVPEKLYSFYAFLRNEEVHILYNELKENLKIINEFDLEKGYYNKPKDCQLVHCKIDLKSGVLKSKESILELEKDGVAVYPRETKVLNDGSLLFLGVKPEYSLKEPSYIRFGHWILD
jgi:hypothetical protein